MYKGNQDFYKSEIVLYIFTLLLTEKRLEPSFIKNKFNISTITLSRYIATIKNMLVEFDIYFIDIFYDRKYACYRCVINQ